MAVLNRKEVDIMAIVITNGDRYITYNKNGGTMTTRKIENAYQFENVKEAVKGMKKAEGKTRKYYVYDTETQYVLWKWMTAEEIEEIRTCQRDRGAIISKGKHGKIKRKTYSEDTRKLIYLHAGGRCELCGKKILLDDMTIDHVKPLSMGGEDDVSNLACVCLPCNVFKGNILPENFIDRINDIFLYQTEKKTKHPLKWKIVHRLLLSCIK